MKQLATLSGLALSLLAANPPAMAAEPGQVIATYADIAAAAYGDSLSTARTLRQAVGDFLRTPSAAGQEAAKRAWLAARVPYQQTEAYRFGNASVDAWEGKVNAWPLDEGLIDYVAAAYGDSSDENPWYRANVIANPRLEIGGEVIDATVIDAALLQKLQEIDGIEANVATGYHAIEFLLWGQDLHGTAGGKGERPWTDYAPGAACTNAPCDRRGQYLLAASDLLTADLEEMATAWQAGGTARAELLAKTPQEGLATMLTGLGSLAYGELAGERTKLGLLLNDPEEEHDCFADNTHNSHYYDVVGMLNVWFGNYRRVDGTVLQGPSLRDYAAAANARAAQDLSNRFDQSLTAATRIKDAADSGKMAYDQMLDPGNAAGKALLEGLVAALVAQTEATERVVAALGLGRLAFEGSDSLDNPGAVQ